MRKRFSRDHCCRGRSKPGCRIVVSHTRWELTTWADFQLCLHRLLMSTGCKSSHSSFLDVSRSNGGLSISGIVTLNTENTTALTDVVEIKCFCFSWTKQQIMQDPVRGNEEKIHEIYVATSDKLFERCLAGASRQCHHQTVASLSLSLCICWTCGNFSVQSQLSQRGHTMPHVTEYSLRNSRSLKIIQMVPRKLGYGFLFIFHSNYSCFNTMHECDRRQTDRHCMTA